MYIIVLVVLIGLERVFLNIYYLKKITLLLDMFHKNESTRNESRTRVQAMALTYVL